MSKLSTGKDALNKHRHIAEDIKPIITPNDIPIVAHFEKVSYEQFEKDCLDILFATEERDDPSQETLDLIKVTYVDILLPRRKTIGSAGYDFFSPIDFELEVNKENPFERTIIIPTGIKCKIKEGWNLDLYPRSGLGFKHRLQLDNTVGIIDSDYYNNEDNEGHILIKVSCGSFVEGHKFTVCKGYSFAQGIFRQYGISSNFNLEPKAEDIRTGGIGSTGK